MRYRILLPVVLLALATTSFAGVVVVNAASFRPGEPVAAGSIASAYRSEGAPTKFPGVVRRRTVAHPIGGRARARKRHRMSSLLRLG